jgi:stage II sporulation protein P
MKKRFKGKRKRKFKKKVFLIIIALIIFNFTFNSKKSIPSLKLLNLFIDTSKFDIKNLNNRDFILKYTLGINENNEKDDKGSIQGDILVEVNPTVENKENEKPLVYIYNTHQSETYHKDLVEAYNISPTVMLTSYMLQEELISLGIPTIVEKGSIKDVLNKNKWIYKDSYKASRILLEKAYNDYPSLKVFIDIHRDSSKYQNTTYKNKNKNYAKVLFVVGLDYDGYKTNLDSANSLNEILKEENPYISRGVYKKTGKGVNGVYNQNFKPNTFLIEIGGQYNNIEEVKNTISYLAKSIFIYIKEKINEEEI